MVPKSLSTNEGSVVVCGMSAAGPTSSVVTDLLVPQLVRAQAHSNRDSVALAGAGELISYGELESRANEIACYLRSLGVGPDTLVGICVKRSPLLAVAALAVWRSGGAYVPLDPGYPAERLEFMCRDSNIKVLLTERDLDLRIEGGWSVVHVDQAITTDIKSPTALPGGVVCGDSLAYVIYTSGSTGRPKGVEITHRSLLNLVEWHRRAFLVTAADRSAQLASVGFDAAVWELWPYLCAGASVHFPDEELRMNPQLLRDWLLTQRITISFAPTPIAEELIFLEWPCESALRILLTGGDTLHHYPPSGLPFTLINNYGPTECTVVTTSGAVPPEKGADSRPTIGFAIDNVQLYVFDEQLKECPDGAVGELYVGGAGLARGYVNLPQVTSDKFIQRPSSNVPGDRLYKTGDLVRRLPDGQLAFIGRRDDQIKIRGFRIEPAEIISVLNGHSNVQSSVVIGRADGFGGHHLVAYVVKRSPNLTGGDLRDFTARRLPEHMVPSIFVEIDSLPLAPNGKVDKTALPIPTDDNILREDVFTSPRTIIESKVAEIMASLLKVASIGAKDNFFLLGGHSLLGTQVISRIRGAFGVELSLLTLFENATVAELAAKIEELILIKLENTQPVQ